MTQINLLIIEDEPAQIQVYEDIIFQHNKKSEYQVVQEVCKDYDEGKKALDTPFYDAAVIDLKLSGTDELEGKKLVEAVQGKIRIPIIIYSGSIAQIEDIEETALLKKRVRTESFKDILGEIIVVFNTGITQLLRPQGEIDRKLTQIFWSHLADDLETWITHNNQKTLLRYIFSHFQEHMEIDTDGNFEEYHPVEIYITPPIKKYIHTGDLFKIKEDYYFVLTPACDVVFQYKFNKNGEKIPFRKADHLVVAKAKEFDYKTLCLNKNGKLEKSKIKGYVKNDFYRYHYLPSFKGNNGFLIDFQELKTVGFDTEMEKIATISGAFSKDIISRFSLYFARQGQPTFNQDQIVNEFFSRN
ncbi:MAG: response regulator [Roseivirga sp.]|nr:response regulator [Roseivirga sp.]